MNYKELFDIAMKLISSPAKAWEEICVEDRQKVYTSFVYPMIGLCSLAVFLGSLFTYGWGGPQSFQLTMTLCCSVAVAQFSGYFLSAYIINELGSKRFGVVNDLTLTRQYAGYTMVVPFLLQIITGLLPDFRIISWLLTPYIMFVAWEGSKILMKVEEKNRMTYTLISSILLIFLPPIIEYLFNQLTTQLN